MTTDYVLSIDPGVSTGVALLSYDDDSSPELVQGWQIGGGLAGFLGWYRAQTYEYIEGAEVFRAAGLELGHMHYGHWTDEVAVVAEKFQPINHSNYALTTASVEPLRIEGAMVALGMMPDYTVEEKRWRRPVDQYVTGGKDKADKKKRLHRFLKESGMYVTGKTLNAPDADDARSAIGHALAYLLKVVKHKPTYELLQR